LLCERPAFDMTNNQSSGLFYVQANFISKQTTTQEKQ